MARVKNKLIGKDQGKKKIIAKKLPKELVKSRQQAKFISQAAKKPKKFYEDVGLLEDPNKVIGLNKRKKLKKTPTSKFVEELEKKANKPQKKNFKFGKVMCQELEYYINKYGDDYESMARDKKNIYQDSPGQLRYKINKYNKIHKSNQQSA